MAEFVMSSLAEIGQHVDNSRNRVLPIYRDYPYSTFMKTATSLQIISQNGIKVALQYTTSDGNGKKAVLVPTTQSVGLCDYIRDLVRNGTSVLVDVTENEKEWEFGKYMEGGNYLWFPNARECPKKNEYIFRKYSLPDFAEHLAEVGTTSLPTQQIPEYLQWIEQNTSCFALISKGNMRPKSVVALQYTPFPIVSYHWDDGGEFSLIGTLFALLVESNLLNCSVSAMAPKSYANALSLSGFTLTSSWRLFYDV